MIKIKVNEELVNYIEGLQYDLQGMQDLIARMSSNNNNEELNSFWLNKYLEKNAEYNMAKQELENQFIKPNIDFNNYKWTLDFNSCEVTITNASQE